MAKTKITQKGTELPLLNLKGKDYLQVAHRIVWFREENPHGIIKTTLVEHNVEKQHALFKAEIFVQIVNESGQGGELRLVSDAHKMETAKGFPDYIEKAETGAIGRALALAGFGTQFEPELDEGVRLADSPVDIPTKVVINNKDLTAPNPNLVDSTKPVEPAKRASFRKSVVPATDTGGGL